MAKIYPEAQAFIDRLARIDPARPRHDKAAIEQAITAHLIAHGHPQCPILWVDDAQSGCRIVKGRSRDVMSYDALQDARFRARCGRSEDLTAWRGAEVAAWKTMRLPEWFKIRRAL